MSAATSTPTLSDQDLGELLGLIKGADSVELKLTVPVSDRSQGAAALGVDPLDARSGRSTSSTRQTCRCTRAASLFARVACRGKATTLS